ncbi:hypothetical protein [Clostridium cylindrosporum]|uniref:Uncharacterized protein n=1 Tax=Clostridium cylindrosporum DSM 605 TaxID=1121307 RepID=A0A0J8G3H1_CLOCY|nr:hypothetical protein [Clostridium cylindrosporum]KMT22261.1 hypothetical protein CLCY_4c02340 [Clostridium cylindrosporum DSM 605]
MALDENLFQNGEIPTRNEALRLLLASLAVEQFGLGRLINAEARKVEEIVGAQGSASISDLERIDRSVERTLRSIIKKEMLIEFQLEDILEFIRTRPCPPTPGEGTCQGLCGVISRGENNQPGPVTGTTTPEGNVVTLTVDVCSEGNCNDDLENGLVVYQEAGVAQLIDAEVTDVICRNRNVTIIEGTGTLVRGTEQTEGTFVLRITHRNNNTNNQSFRLRFISDEQGEPNYNSGRIVVEQGSFLANSCGDE